MPRPRPTAPWPLAVSALAAVLTLALPLSAQQRTTRERVDVILATSKIDTLLVQEVGGISGELMGRVPPGDSAALRAALESHFSPAALREVVASAMALQASDSILTALEGWLFDGPVAEMRAMGDAADPNETLEEYAAGLQAAPPDEQRLQTVAEHARVQQAPGFYLVLEEAHLEIFEAVDAAVADREPRPVQRTDAEYEQALQMYFSVAVVSFLQRYEAVPLETISASTERFASPEGQWYVERYSLALADAIREAGMRVAEELRAAGGRDR